MLIDPGHLTLAETPQFRISEQAERSGFPASTLRFYEHAGPLLVAVTLTCAWSRPAAP
jgi:hypothetical protein